MCKIVWYACRGQRTELGIALPSTLFETRLFCWWFFIAGLGASRNSVSTSCLAVVTQGLYTRAPASGITWIL